MVGFTGIFALHRMTAHQSPRGSVAFRAVYECEVVLHPRIFAQMSLSTVEVPGVSLKLVVKDNYVQWTLWPRRCLHA